MIDTAAQLLEQLWQKGAGEIERFPNPRHGGLVGDMWEGLSRDLIDRAVFDHLDLRVAKGKVRNSAGALSRQIDCMVVRGPGLRLPFTEHDIYDSKDVIAVVEVKKRLDIEDLRDGIELLHDLASRIAEPHPMPARIAEHPWRGVTGKPFPAHQDVGDLPPAEENLYHLLVTEAWLPLRIIWGHTGYKTESGLRDGFARCVGESVPQPNSDAKWKPYSLPNLVISGSNTIIKTNGMPYQGPSHADGFWTFYGSQHRASMRALLEILWTRISYQFGVSSTTLFGDDLALERVPPLFRIRYEPTPAPGRWNMEQFRLSMAQLADDATQMWEPHEVSDKEHVVLAELCKGREVSLDEQELVEFFGSVDDLTAAVRRLRDLRLIYVDGGRLHLLTDQLRCLILDNKFWAAEDQDGRFSRWVAAVTKRTTKGNEDGRPDVSGGG